MPGRALVLAASLALAVLVWAGAAGPAWAQAGLSGQQFEIAKDRPVDVQAEQMRFEEGGDVIYLDGKVVVVHKEDRILCDHARLDLKAKTLEGWGDVDWRRRRDRLQAQTVKLHFDTGLGKAYGVKAFLGQGGFFVTGREVDRIAEDVYVFREGTLTTCDGSPPDWEIRASTVHVTVEGYAHLLFPRFHVAGLPVPALAAPYGIAPAQTKRQSGLLMPQWGFSNRDGFNFELPFFWAWSDWGDSTFYWHHSDRGEGVGQELRFKLGHPSDQGLFFVDYLHDNKAKELFKTKSISSDTTDRYWIRGMMKADHLLPWDMSLFLTVDKTSDKDFIREFGYWKTGLDTINGQFGRDFGSYLPDDTTPDRVSSLQVRKYLDYGNLWANFRYSSDPTKKVNDDSLQRLPMIRFNHNDQAIGKSNLYFNYTLQNQYLYRDYGQRGDEVDLTGSVYSLYHLGNYLQIRPFLGQRITWWYLDKNSSTSSEDSGTRFRNYWFPGVDLSTTVYNVYDFGSQNWQRVKHQIMPELTFTYIPEHYDPAPDGLGATVAPQELTTYSLTNTLTTKNAAGLSSLDSLREELLKRQLESLDRQRSGASGRVGALSDAALQAAFDREYARRRDDPAPKYSYTEIVRLWLAQSFDFRKLRVEPPAGQPQRPFSDVEGEFRVTPSSYLSTRTTLTYNPYKNRFSRLTQDLTVRDAKYATLTLSYQNRWTESNDKTTTDQIIATLLVKIWGPWSAGFSITHDLGKNDTISRSVGISYMSQCWGFRIHYQADELDQRVVFYYTLRGIL